MCITEEACANTFLPAQLFILQKSCIFPTLLGFCPMATGASYQPLALQWRQCRLAGHESLCAELFTTQTSFNVSFRRN